MFKINQWQIEQKEQKKLEDQIRNVMLAQNITYHEAKELVIKGQKTLFNFKHQKPLQPKERPF